jgi:hypothetical protein
MFVWFVLGEKNDSGRTPAEDPPLQNDHCTTLKVVSKPLIINDIVVEAMRVELFRVLTTRKLLILAPATTAQTAPLPDPLYVYCTKTLFALESRVRDVATSVSHRFAVMDREIRRHLHRQLA